MELINSSVWARGAPLGVSYSGWSPRPAPPRVRTEKLALRPVHRAQSIQLLRHHLQVAGGFRSEDLKAAPDPSGKTTKKKPKKKTKKKTKKNTKKMLEAEH